MDLASHADIAGEKNKPETVTCSLCGFQFNKAQAACGGCAMTRGCGMIKCPNCHFEFVTESKVVKWIQKILKN